MRTLLLIAALSVAAAPAWASPPAGGLRLLYGSSISGEIEPCG